MVVRFLVHSLQFLPDVQKVYQTAKNDFCLHTFILTLHFIILKNGQTYFKNLAVFTPKDF